jgi:hypothetical protein
MQNGKRRKGPPCIVCGGESCCRVDIETSHMRGDDEVVHACSAHKDDANALWEAFNQRRARVAAQIVAKGEMP